LIRVLAVDDHHVVLEGLRVMLQTDPEIELVGTAATGEAGVAAADELRPDVVLMDIVLPGIDGIEATRRIKEAHPEIGVVILTILVSDVYIIEAVNAGAAGYLTKDCTSELLRYAVRSVCEGGTMFRSELLHHAVGNLTRRPGPFEGVDPSLARRLTEREIDVLRLLSQGQSNREICESLCLASVTVKKHVQNIVGKLGVSDRTQAAILGVRLGLAGSVTPLDRGASVA